MYIIIRSFMIWTYLLSSTLYSGPIQSRLTALSKSVASASGNRKAAQENRALVAAGQGDGAAAAPAAQAVAQPTASLSYIKWLRREWNPYKFNAWFDNPKWSFCAVGHNGSRREFTSLSCSPDGNSVAAGERMTLPLPVFQIDRTTGTLKGVNGPYAYEATGFDVVAYSPDSKRVAALRRAIGWAIGFGNPCLALFDVDAASGKLTPTKDFKLVVDNFSPSSHIAYSPNGKWLALSNSKPDKIFPNGEWIPGSSQDGVVLTIFAVHQETGNLVQNFSMTERDYTRGLPDIHPCIGKRTETHSIQFSPDSNWLITTDILHCLVNVFKVNAHTGSLTFTSRISLKDPGNVAFSPDAQHVAITFPYAQDIGENYQWVKHSNVSLFQFDTNTGSLKPIVSSVSGNIAACALAFSPGGKTIAVTHCPFSDSAPESALTIFKFDEDTQELKQVPGSPFAAPKVGSKSVCYSHDGQLLFVGSASDDRIWVYEVDEFTGSVDFITGEPLLKVQKKYDYAVRLLEQNNYIIPAIAKFVRGYCYQEMVAAKKPTQEH